MLPGPRQRGVGPWPLGRQGILTPEVLNTGPSQDREFVAKQKEDLELAMKRITADNRREVCDKERECLTRKQELVRGVRPSARRA